MRLKSIWESFIGLISDKAYSVMILPFMAIGANMLNDDMPIKGVITIIIGVVFDKAFRKLVTIKKSMKHEY